VQKSRQFSAEFKVKVAIEALKEQPTFRSYLKGMRFMQPNFLLETGVSCECYQCVYTREEKRSLGSYSQTL
jgi:hypothetical protein